MRKRNFLFICFLSFVINLHAEIKVPRFFSNNMVLQQNEEINIYGIANPAEKITASFKNELKNTIADKNGNWSVKFNASKAGGPFIMELKGENLLKFSEVYVGEVWFCSGQSNMGWKLENATNGIEELQNADYTQIKLFQVSREMSNKPEEDLANGSWETCSPITANGFSAIAYFFGIELYKKYQVPIGLIHSSWGGTNIEAWMSEDLFKNHPNNKNVIEKMKTMDLNNLLKEYSISNKRYGSYLDSEDLGSKENWENSTPDYENWDTFELPNLWSNTNLESTHGVVWVTRLFELSASEIGSDIELSLSRIDDEDITYVNGKVIGASTQKDLDRLYIIPKNILKTGINRITIRTKNLGDLGGFRGAAKDMYLKIAEKTITLEGNWNYKVGTPKSNAPPVREHPKNYPSSLYNSMVNPFFGYNIKGVIWYQGESNTKNPEEYAEFFPQMIQDWRNKWKKDVPFLFVQLANLSGNKELWPAVREAQTSALKLNTVAMVTAIDVGDDNNIHPKNKQIIGKRLGMAAQNVAYGDRKSPVSGPKVKKVKVKNNKIVITFDSPVVIKGDKNAINGFFIENTEHHFIIANAKLVKPNKVEVYSDSIKNPKYLRYLWEDAPGEVMIYNANNLPAPPFKFGN
ncbi:MAG TPA: 9-O-acetylesterase [Lutibacter sp.]|nr:9-O-acetylesterase [Lutibacter sp.]